MNGHCILNPMIDTIKGCYDCYKSWNDRTKTKYGRPQCKRKNWVGMVDEACINDKIEPPINQKFVKSV